MFMLLKATKFGFPKLRGLNTYKYVYHTFA